MPNNELRVFYPANPPSVMTNCISFPPLYSSNNCPFPGLMVEIIGLLARESNLTIRALTAADFGYEPDQLKDVASNGLLDMLKNGTVDLIAMSFQVTQQRERQFSFTEPIYKVQTRVLKQPESKKFTKIWAFFSNYDKYVWIAFAIVWLLQWMLGLLVHQMEANVSGQKAPPLLESTWKFLRMLLRQPEHHRCYLWGGKVSIFLFAFVQCTVLLGLYSSLILANIIKSNDKEVETVGTILDQLMKRERYMVTDAPSKWIFEFINNSLAYPYPEFKRVFKHNPLKVTHSVEETLKEVVENNAVVFIQDDDKVAFESRERCELEAVREGMPLANVNLMLQKDTLLVSILNRAISRNQLHLARLSNKYIEKLRMERLCKDYHGFRPLTIGPYTGICFICLAIIFIAFVAFVIERVVYKIRRRCVLY